MFLGKMRIFREKQKKKSDRADSGGESIMISCLIFVLLLTPMDSAWAQALSLSLSLLQFMLLTYLMLEDFVKNKNSYL